MFLPFPHKEMQTVRLFIALIALGDQAIYAQEPNIFFGAGAMVSGQGSEQPDGEPSVPNSGVGGRAFGLTVEAGAWVSGAMSISFEAMCPTVSRGFSASL